ncbi:MAG: hypothetical protein E7254_09760 [Lachnospiraceae bacterium]|nr:hypothetical protein [Lachnospiraceae bacterium]
MSNSDNPGNGAEFQKQVFEWFSRRYNSSFELEKVIEIGEPKTGHKYDIANEDNTMVIECKRYTWTESGNSPSAKLGVLNEAAFFLSYLPVDCEKYIVMAKAIHPSRDESLAEYYYRRYKHLLIPKNIKLAEFDTEKETLKVF